ncbi:MAG: hypothetical protein GOU97_01265 [Nanoarchaeota archaeon]|nr:hypothetical protein [Nanoarchaeota archaeon]
MNEEVLAWKVIQNELVRDYFEAERISLDWLGDINYLRLDDKKRVVVDVDSIEWTEKSVREILDSPTGLDVFLFCMENSDSWETLCVKGVSSVMKKLDFEKIKLNFFDSEDRVLQRRLTKMNYVDLLSQACNGKYFSTNLGRTFYDMIKTKSF